MREFGMYKSSRTVQTYKIGDLVQVLPRYDLGNRSIGAELIYPFKGTAIIIDLTWPAEARLLTNTGEVVCIQLDKTELIRIPEKKYEKAR